MVLLKKSDSCTVLFTTLPPLPYAFSLLFGETPPFFMVLHIFGHPSPRACTCCQHACAAMGQGRSNGGTSQKLVERSQLMASGLALIMDNYQYGALLSLAHSAAVVSCWVMKSQRVWLLVGGRCSADFMDHLKIIHRAGRSQSSTANDLQGRQQYPCNQALWNIESGKALVCYWAAPARVGTQSRSWSVGGCICGCWKVRCLLVKTQLSIFLCCKMWGPILAKFRTFPLPFDFVIL